jgi:RimJ/RimL family protein N-acetyltransferase
MEMKIREAKPADAEQLIAYVRHLSEEPGSNIELSPGEFNLTVAEEEQILTNYALSANSIYLLAEIAGKIVGTLNCHGSNRQAIRHSVRLGMSVDQAWRGKGVGGQLMARAIEWAKGTGIVSRIELDVFERNEAAIHLYRKYGFVIEGQLRRAIYRDGKYLDALIMALVW